MRFEYSPVIPHRALDRVPVLRNALALCVALHPLSARLIRTVPVTLAFALVDEAPSLEVTGQARPGVCIRFGVCVRFENADRMVRTMAQACVSSGTCGSHFRLTELVLRTLRLCLRDIGTLKRGASVTVTA